MKVPSLKPGFRKLFAMGATAVFLAGIGGVEIRANCPSGSYPVIHGITNHFESCGPSPTTFIWAHGKGIQGVIGALDTANQGNTVSGHDSGGISGIQYGTFSPTDPENPASGSYYGAGDFGSEGWDGCILNTPESPNSCIGFYDYAPQNYVIAGSDPAAPYVAKMAAVSVDWNEFILVWLLDNAGAPVVDGDPCMGDALSGNLSNFVCTPIPAPSLVGLSAQPGGTNVTLEIGDVSSIPILDDCAIAETRALNCPRNLYAGRVLMYKRASCTTVPGDLRAFIFPAPPATGTLAVPPNWLNFSREDGNLNGVLDAGEDGSNGGTVNGRLDPLLIPDVTATTATIFLPANSGATDCLYFALGIGLDANALSVNPPTDTIFGEMVISPLVSMNPIPFAGDTGNPIADLVENISAVKSQGKLAVAWSTITELTTEGFNVIGTKKGGGEIKLNSALIPAQEGTTGLGASYSAVFDGSKLKGSTSVFIDLVKIDGTTARFGPVGF